MSAANTSVLLLIFFIGFLGTIGFSFLQFYLSRKAAWWPGVILPIISFIASFLPLLFLLQASPSYTSVPASIGLILLLTFLVNFPTLVYLIIYFLCRRSKKVRALRKAEMQKKEMDKMNIQDL